MLREVVDWSGGWGTPWGLASLQRSEAAATKRPAGTEINPSFC